MKKFLIGLIVLTSISAFADLGDSHSATTIAPGSVFTLSRDLIIPASNKILFKDGEPYKYYREVSSGPFCRLSAVDENFNAFGKDVRITAETNLEVVSQVARERYAEIYTITPQGNFVAFFCNKSIIDGNGTGVPTVGEVKKSFMNLMNLNLKITEPTDI